MSIMVHGAKGKAQRNELVGPLLLTEMANSGETHRVLISSSVSQR